MRSSAARTKPVPGRVDGQLVEAARNPAPCKKLPGFRRENVDPPPDPVEDVAPGPVAQAEPAPLPLLDRVGQDLANEVRQLVGIVFQRKPRPPASDPYRSRPARVITEAIDVLRPSLEREGKEPVLHPLSGNHAPDRWLVCEEVPLARGIFPERSSRPAPACRRSGSQ